MLMLMLTLFVRRNVMCKKMILLMSFVLVLSLVGSVQAIFDTWTEKESNANRVGVAMSADGTIQVVPLYQSSFHISTDSGNTWTAKGQVEAWRSAAISADGTIQIAGGKFASYVSTDTGNTWTKNLEVEGRSVAISADGTIQTVVPTAGRQAFVSTDTGITWTGPIPIASSGGPFCPLAMSADGTIQTVAVQANMIYVSTDTGTTWIAKGPIKNWMGLAMSADGTIQTAADQGGKIYVSTDTGNTWTAKASDRDWSSVAMSADGRMQTATVSDGKIYVSTDTGNTWTAKESDRAWNDVAMSADGTIQTAVVWGGQIYVCSEDPVLVNLNPIPSDGSVVPVSTFNNKLQWTLPEPNDPGDEVLCDVHFGTDPNVWDNPKIVDMEAVEDVDITVTGDTTYYWVVTINDPSLDPVLSDVFTFTTITNIAPVVEAGPNVETWLADGLPIPEGTERVVQLNGIVDDDGNLQSLSYLWTVISEPDSGTHPAVISSDNIVNPTITMTLPGLYELELAAYDGEFTVTDSMVIQLYDTSCTHAQNQEGFGWLAADINHDCKVNLPDFANMAANWLEEYYSTE